MLVKKNLKEIRKEQRFVQHDDPAKLEVDAAYIIENGYWINPC